MEFKGTEVYKNFKHKFKDKIIKYIEAMYSKTSDLNKVEGFEEKHQQACLKASISAKEDIMIEIFELRNKEVNALIDEYIINQHSNKYQGLLTEQRLYFYMQRMINAPYDENLNREEQSRELKMRDDMALRSEGVRARIDRLYSEIYKYRDVIVEIAQEGVTQRLTLEQRLKQKEKTNVQ
jgi:hypothetical protein